MLLRRPRPGQASPPPGPLGNTQRRPGAAPRSYRHALGIATSPFRLRWFGGLALALFVVMATAAAMRASLFRSPPSVERPSPPSLIVTTTAVREIRGALVVPVSSVVVQDGREIVFRLQGPGSESKVRARAVVVGRRINDNVEVVGRLAAGDRIVAHGAGVLVDRDLVRVESPTATSLMGLQADDATAVGCDVRPAR